MNTSIKYNDMHVDTYEGYLILKCMRGKDYLYKELWWYAGIKRDHGGQQPAVIKILVVTDHM